MAIRLLNCTKSFGSKKILDAVSFQLLKGEIVGIFGRNGTGKSTLLQLLFGVQKADEMRLSINGDVMSGKEIIVNQLVGYVPQFSFLPQSARVWDVVPLYCEDGEAQDKIYHAPRFSSMGRMRVGKLSMGQRRYLELLLVGHLDHPYLLLDEPFSMVEPLYKEVISEFLISLTSKKGIVVSDHYYEDVWNVSDRRLLLKNGKLIEVSQLSDLMHHGYLRSSHLDDKRD